MVQRLVGEVGIKGTPVVDGFYRELQSELRKIEQRAKKDPVEVPVTLVGSLRDDLARKKLEASGQDAVEIPVGLDLDSLAFAHAKKLLGEFRETVHETVNTWERAKFEDKAAKIKADAEVEAALAQLAAIDTYDPKITIDAFVNPSTIEKIKAIFAEIPDEIVNVDAQVNLAELEHARELFNTIPDEIVEAEFLPDLDSLLATKNAADALLSDVQVKADIDLDALARVKEAVAAIPDETVDLRPDVSEPAMASALARLAAFEDVTVDVLPELIPAAVAEVKAEAKGLLSRITMDVLMALDESSAAQVVSTAIRIAKVTRPVIEAGVRVSKAAVAKVKGTVSAMFRAIGRPTVEVALRVSKASVAKVMATLHAISGMKLFQSISADLSDMFTRFDKLALSISGVGLAVASVSMLAVGLSGALVAVAGDLAAIGGLAATLPAFLGGAVVSAVVLGSALKDAKTVLGDLGPAMSQLQDTISANFWDAAAQPIRDLVNTHLPAVEAGVARVSASMGGAVAAFVSSFSGALSDGALTTMFDNLALGFDNASLGAAALGEAVAALGTAGSQYLPQFGQWLTDISVKFNEWVQVITSDGSLEAWVQRGLAQLNNLFSIFQSLYTIFTELGGVVESAGFTGLDGIAASLSGAANAIQSSGVKDALGMMFAGARAGMDEFGAGLSALFGSIMTMAPTLQSVFQSVGATLGSISQGIATMLSDPAMQKGISDLFAGIQAGVQALGPVFASMGGFLGPLLTAVGQFVGALGPFFAALAGTGPVFGELMTVVGQLAELLMGQLGQALALLLPPIMNLVSSLLPPLTALLTSIIGFIAPLAAALAPIVEMVAVSLGQVLAMLIPMLTGIVNTILPVVVQVMAALAPLLMPIMSAVMSIVQAVLPPLIGLIMQLLPPIMQLVQALLPPIGALLGVIGGVLEWLAPIIGNIIGFIATVVGGILTFVIGVITGIVTAISAFPTWWETQFIPFLAGVVAYWSNIWNSVSNFFQSTWDKINAAIALAKAWVVSTFIGIVNSVKEKIEEVKTFVANIPSTVTNAIGNVGDTLVNAGKSIIEGFLNGLKNAFEDVKSFVGGIADWIAQNKGPESYDRKLLVRHGGWIMDGLDKGLEDGFVNVQGRVSRMGAGIQSAFNVDKNGAWRLSVDGGPGMGTTLNAPITMPRTDPNVVLDKFAVRARRAVRGVA